MDETDTAILLVAEDCILGFHRHPFAEISRLCRVPESIVIERICVLLKSGVLRRVRQTLQTTKLAQGALVAWAIHDDLVDEAFHSLVHDDPFTGHVVVRNTDPSNPGSNYKLWTTLKVPVGSNSLQGHCSMLAKHIGARDFILLPARGVFALGVGHLRRRNLQVGEKLPHPAHKQTTELVELSPLEWSVLLTLKEELSLTEVTHEPWALRASMLGMSLQEFCTIASNLDRKQVIGRFASFLEHVKQTGSHGVITRFNGLFHWTVPEGLEEVAGAECGRHLCMTHCYWRTGGESFGGAQIMGVVHGLEQDSVLAHKAAIDAHLQACDIPILHTAVFWGQRSEIKPSEISPVAYTTWLQNFIGTK